ncbi:hypothetical protein AAVH_42045, partial [Aphelenchoides avenae]
WIIGIGAASVVVVAVSVLGVAYCCGWRPRLTTAPASGEAVQLVYDQPIGYGAFASVYKGRFSPSRAGSTEEVAVK